MNTDRQKFANLPRLRQSAPRWWASYCERRGRSDHELNAYEWNFTDTDDDLNFNVDCVPGRFIRASTRYKYMKLRAVSRHPSYTARRYNAVLVYLGCSCFVWVPYDATPFERRAIFHKAHDLLALNRHDRSFLCRDSACRFYNAPLLLDYPQVHIGRDPIVEGSYPRSVVPKHHFGTAIQRCWHRTHSDTDVRKVKKYYVTSKLQTLLDVLNFMPEPDFIVPGDYLLRKLVGIDPSIRFVPDDMVENIRDSLSNLVPSRQGRYSQEKILKRFDLLSPLAESPMESLTRLMCVKAGLPTPKLQYQVNGRVNNRRYFVDMAWPQYGLAIEVDGLSKYSNLNDIREEKNRENELYAFFPYVKRVTWKTLSTWDGFIGIFGY